MRRYNESKESAPLDTYEPILPVVVIISVNRTALREVDVHTKREKKIGSWRCGAIDMVQKRCIS
jgi:hypothetical protein